MTRKYTVARNCQTKQINRKVGEQVKGVAVKEWLMYRLCVDG